MRQSRFAEPRGRWAVVLIVLLTLNASPTLSLPRDGFERAAYRPAERSLLQSPSAQNVNITCQFALSVRSARMPSDAWSGRTILEHSLQLTGSAPRTNAQGLAFTADVFATSISAQAPLQQRIASLLTLDESVRIFSACFLSCHFGSSPVTSRSRHSERI